MYKMKINWRTFYQSLMKSKTINKNFKNFYEKATYNHIHHKWYYRIGNDFVEHMIISYTHI